jgi:hypothetical protein
LSTAPRAAATSPVGEPYLAAHHLLLEHALAVRALRGEFKLGGKGAARPTTTPLRG